MDLFFEHITPSVPGLLIAATLVIAGFAVGEHAYPRSARLAAFLSSLQLAFPILIWDLHIRIRNAGIPSPEWIGDVFLVAPPLITFVTPLALHRTRGLAVACGVVSLAIWGFILFVLALAGRG